MSIQSVLLINGLGRGSGSPFCDPRTRFGSYFSHAKKSIQALPKRLLGSCPITGPNRGLKQPRPLQIPSIMAPLNCCWWLLGRVPHSDVPGPLALEKRGAFPDFSLARWAGGRRLLWAPSVVGSIPIESATPIEPGPAGSIFSYHFPSGSCKDFDRRALCVVKSTFCVDEPRAAVALAGTRKQNASRPAATAAWRFLPQCSIHAVSNAPARLQSINS